jgi:hypothetical protein
VIWRLAVTRTAFSAPPPLFCRMFATAASCPSPLLIFCCLIQPHHSFVFRWQPAGATQFQDFPLDVCVRLEQALTHGLLKLDVPEKLWYDPIRRLTVVSFSDVTYRTFDFVAMTQTIHNSQDVNKIQRSVFGRLATTRNFENCRELSVISGKEERV